MKANNHSNHPLDDYIHKGIENLDIQYDPASWQSVNEKLQQANYQKSQESLSKMKLRKFTKIISLSTLVLVILSIFLLNTNKKQNKDKIELHESNHSIKSNIQPENENTIDTTTIELDKKVYPNLTKPKEKTFTDDFIHNQMEKHKIPIKIDTLNFYKLDTTQLIKSQDSTKIKRKKHIIW
jgi:hypothetical protein